MRTLLSIAAASVAASVTSAPASAAPCWSRVLADYRDGRIDRTYSAACYRAALDHLPADLQIYGSAADDITRSMREAALLRRSSGRSRPAAAATTTAAAAAPTRTVAASRTRRPESASPVPHPRRQADPAVAAARAPAAVDAPVTDPSFPWPVLLAGGAAALLLLSAATRLARRRLARRGPQVRH